MGTIFFGMGTFGILLLVIWLAKNTVQYLTQQGGLWCCCVQWHCAQLKTKIKQKLPLGSCLSNVKYRDYFVGEIVQDDIF